MPVPKANRSKVAEIAIRYLPRTCAHCGEEGSTLGHERECARRPDAGQTPPPVKPRNRGPALTPMLEKAKKQAEAAARLPQAAERAEAGDEESAEAYLGLADGMPAADAEQARRDRHAREVAAMRRRLAARDAEQRERRRAEEAMQREAERAPRGGGGGAGASPRRARDGSRGARRRRRGGARGCDG